jgi:hypothetical protein
MLTHNAATVGDDNMTDAERMRVLNMRAQQERQKATGEELLYTWRDVDEEEVEILYKKDALFAFGKEKKGEEGKEDKMDVDSEKKTEEESSLLYEKNAAGKWVLNKKDVNVVFGMESLKISIKGQVIFDGELFSKIDKSLSCWTIANGTDLQLTLMKKDEAVWPRVGKKE